MQLLYGNDGINYHTIARSQNMTDMQEKELLAGYLGYEFVKDAALYSSADKEPVALTCVTTNLSQTLPEEKILLSINGRMTNYLTPSYWAHFQLLDITPESYGDEFFGFLQYSFIQDTEVNEYLHKDIDTFKGKRKENGSIRDNALDKESIVVLVAAVLNVADSLSRQIKVILDVEGDLYNQRALEIIASVYKYIPFNIRKTAGFCTYAKTDGNGSNRVKLLLYAREKAGLLDKDAIDLKHLDSKKELSRIPSEIVALAREFVEAQDNIRMEWFHGFQSVFGTQTVSVEEHQIMFRNVRKWKNQELGSMLDEIAVYAYKEQMRQTETLVYRMFCNIMNKRFAEEQYALKYGQIVKKLLEQQRNFRFSNQLSAYLALGEAISCIRFETPVFLSWEQNNIINPLKEEFDEEELIAQLKGQFLQLHKLKSGGAKFAEICLQMENLIKASVEEVREQIKLRTQKEKQKIESFLQSRSFFLADVNELIDRYSGIKYKSNCAVFSNGLQRNTGNYLKELSYFSSYKEYCDYKAYLVKLQPYLSKEIFDELGAAAEQKGNVVKAMQQYKNIEWNHRNQILDSYQNIYMMRNLKQGKKLEIPDYRIQINSQSFAMNEMKLLSLMQFLLSPSDSRAGAAKDMLLTDRGLFEGLMHIEAFGTEHFPYLIGWWQDEDMQGKIISYYANGIWLLSKEQMKEYENRQKKELQKDAAELKQVNISAKKKRKRLIIILSVVAMILIAALAVFGIVFWLRIK